MVDQLPGVIMPSDKDYNRGSLNPNRREARALADRQTAFDETMAPAHCSGRDEAERPHEGISGRRERAGRVSDYSRRS